MPEIEKFLFARKEAAFSLGLCIRSIDHLIAREELATRRIGRKVLVTRESLRLFARGNHPESLNQEPDEPNQEPDEPNQEPDEPNQEPDEPVN